MWVMTKNGFVSAVQNRANKDEIVLRARTRRHIIAVTGKEVGIIDTLHSDYRFRVVIGREEFAEIVMRQIEQINYDNFKYAVGCHTPQDENYVEALHKTWEAMYHMQCVEDLKEMHVHGNHPDPEGFARWQRRR